jgi:hypothetical protein
MMVVLAGCTPQNQAREHWLDVQRAVENEDAEALAPYLAPDFRGPTGWSREQTIQWAQGWWDRTQPASITLLDMKVDERPGEWIMQADVSLVQGVMGIGRNTTFRVASGWRTDTDPPQMEWATWEALPPAPSR